jgi:phosphoribosylanthranilate isomerase
MKLRMPTLIKICGVKDPAHVVAAADAGAHAIGLNFVPQSKRFVGGVDRAAQLIAACSPVQIIWAGVFVNPDFDELIKTQEALKLGILQLHGDESPEFVRRVKARAGSVKVWKAFRVAARADLMRISEFECDGILLDAKVIGERGGTGQAFDWTILKDFKRTAPLILSGGLTPQNVAEAIGAVNPDWVDVASGVESAPGRKSAILIAEFIRIVKKQDASRH